MKKQMKREHKHRAVLAIKKKTTQKNWKLEMNEMKWNEMKWLLQSFSFNLCNKEQ